MSNFDYKKYLAEGKLLKENVPERLGPSSQFTFEPSDPKKDLMIHTIVDEYQEKIFDYLWNYELYRNEYLKEDINNDYLAEGKLLKEVRGPIEKIELHIKNILHQLQEYTFLC